MKSHFLIAGILGLSLTGCGVAESVTKAVVGGVVDAMVQATACSISSTMSFAVQKMDLYIIQEDLSRLQSQIRDQKISNTADFWNKLSVQDVKDTRVWVKEGFDKLSEKGAVQNITLNDYEEILAQGLISATQKNSAAGVYYFSRALTEKSGDTTIVKETYTIRLKVYGAPNDEEQSFVNCTQK